MITGDLNFWISVTPWNSKGKDNHFWAFPGSTTWTSRACSGRLMLTLSLNITEASEGLAQGLDNTCLNTVSFTIQRATKLIYWMLLLITLKILGPNTFSFTQFHTFILHQKEIQYNTYDVITYLWCNDIHTHQESFSQQVGLGSFSEGIASVTATLDSVPDSQD